MLLEQLVVAEIPVDAVKTHTKNKHRAIDRESTQRILTWFGTESPTSTKQIAAVFIAYLTTRVTSMDIYRLTIIQPGIEYKYTKILIPYPGGLTSSPPPPPNPYPRPARVLCAAEAVPKCT